MGIFTTAGWFVQLIFIILIIREIYLMFQDMGKKGGTGGGKSTFEKTLGDSDKGYGALGKDIDDAAVKTRMDERQKTEAEKKAKKEAKEIAELQNLINSLASGGRDEIIRLRQNTLTLIGLESQPKFADLGQEICTGLINPMIKDTNNLKEETQKIRIATIGAAQKLRALDISIKALRDATNKREADYEKELKLLLKKQERIKKILDKNYDTDEKINVSEASKNNHGALRAGEIQVVKDIEEMQKTIEQNKELSRVEKTKYAEVINKIEKTELPEDQNTTNTERAILNILNTISRDLQQIYQGALRTYELREDPERAIDEKKRNYDQKLPKLRENVDLLAENYKSFLIRLMKLTETLQEIEKIFGVNVKMMTNQLNPNVNVPPPRTKGPLDVHFSHGPGRFV